MKFVSQRSTVPREHHPGRLWYVLSSTVALLCLRSHPDFVVQLDTGSTDLVLFPDRPIKTTKVYKDSDVNATYGTGWTAGPIAAAKLEFGGLTVESQGAFFPNVRNGPHSLTYHP